MSNTSYTGYSNSSKGSSNGSTFSRKISAPNFVNTELDNQSYRDNAKHQRDLVEIEINNGNFEAAEDHLNNAEYDEYMIND